jgi:hypothetical protein
MERNLYRVERICPTCENYFAVPPSELKRGGIYCSKKCYRRIGPDNPRWRGGQRAHGQGYLIVSYNNERVLEHRHVMEAALGRPLKRNEIVHHRNGNRTDNRRENLVVMTQAEHLQLYRGVGGKGHKVDSDG